jgi:drug/metabolite transporter (DMT)-like permease
VRCWRLRCGRVIRCAAPWALFRSRWFSLGLAVALVAWGLHVGALALAPLSVVQAVLSGGLVFLAVLAERYFGFHLGRRQWAGLIATAAGLAVIAVTGGSHTSGRCGTTREPVKRRGASGASRQACV